MGDVQGDIAKDMRARGLNPYGHVPQPEPPATIGDRPHSVDLAYEARYRIGKARVALARVQNLRDPAVQAVEDELVAALNAVDTVVDVLWGGR